MFWLMSALPPKAAVARTLLDFAFVPDSDISQIYSITSSARASTWATLADRAPWRS
jgi:hypothetical protein